MVDVPPDLACILDMLVSKIRSLLALAFAGVTGCAASRPPAATEPCSQDGPRSEHASAVEARFGSVRVARAGKDSVEPNYVFRAGDRLRPAKE
jgi:hypothetical protein